MSARVCEGGRICTGGMFEVRGTTNVVTKVLLELKTTNFIAGVERYVIDGRFTGAFTRRCMSKERVECPKCCGYTEEEKGT